MPKKIILLDIVCLVIASFAIYYDINLPDFGAGQKAKNGLIIKCDDSLWQRTYAGDPRKFKSPQDRLKIINPCTMVTGKIVNAKTEADGDWHIQLDLDAPFKSMLNAKNVSGQKGYLVLEPVCENSISQLDTLKEGACKGYTGHIFDKSMIGKHVSVVGPYVTDQEHGWNEIHPVNSITVQ